MNQDQMKQAAALAALEFVTDDSIVGVGTGSTANYFIDGLAAYKNRIEGAVPSSHATERRLKSLGIPVIELNSAEAVDIYVDGADEINTHLQCIKGGGGALTGEKIIAAVAKTFICIADEKKYVKMLGKFPVAVEVIPMARSYVAREILKLKGDPVYREGFVTDYGNLILDVHNLEIYEPIQLEKTLNQIVGVVTNGLFALRTADKLLMGTATGVQTIHA